MTTEEIATRFDIIDRQNAELLDAIASPEFEGAVKLDPTINHAQTFIHLANEAIVTLPQGAFPIHLSAPAIASTDALLAACESRYGRLAVMPMAQAFHAIENLWNYNGPPTHPSTLFAKKIFDAEDRLLSAICSFNQQILAQSSIHEDALKYEQIVQLAKQVKSLGNQGEICDKINSLLRNSRRNASMLRETLWHASGKLPQYKPTDGRSVNSVKESMVQLAVDRILSGNGSSPRTILNTIIEQYAEVSGGYDSLTPFLRQVERVMKKSEHNLKDMF